MLIPILLFGQNETKTNIDSVKDILITQETKLVINYERQIYSGEKFVGMVV